MAVAHRIVERAWHAVSRLRTNVRRLSRLRSLAKAAHGIFRRYVSDQIDFLVRAPKHHAHTWTFGRRRLNHEAACSIPSASDPRNPVALENVDIISERQYVFGEGIYYTYHEPFRAMGRYFPTIYLHRVNVDKVFCLIGYPIGNYYHGRDRDRARPAVGEGFPFPLFRLQARVHSLTLAHVSRRPPIMPD